MMIYTNKILKYTHLVNLKSTPTLIINNSFNNINVSNNKIKNCISTDSNNLINNNRSFYNTIITIINLISMYHVKIVPIIIQTLQSIIWIQSITKVESIDDLIA